MEDWTVKYALPSLVATFLALNCCVAGADGAELWSAGGGEAYGAPEAAEPVDLCAPGWCPLWTVRAGAVILHRSQPDDPEGLLFLAGAGETPDFDWSAGPDVSIIRQFGSGGSLEVRYFGALNFQIDDEFAPNPVIAFGADYSSRLHSTEFNWRRPYSERIKWLAGFRWIELHEEFTFSQDISIVPILIDLESNVDNHLYGGQVGLDVNFLRGCGPWSLDGVFKAGLYGDFADRDFQVAINGTPVGGIFEDDTDAAFVGEIGVAAGYDLSDHWALRGGYQLLWINGAALADEQFDAELNLSGDIFYHGALVGLERTW